MAVFLSPVFGVAGQVFDDNGNPLAGGKIYTYAAGTTTNATTYTTSAGNISHTNPIVLDGAGRVPSGEIWLSDGVSYKFVVEDANNVLIGTYDNITGINSNFVAFTNSQEIQTATAGQTVFTLTTMQYQPGTNSLSVFVDGVNQYGPGAQYAYVETNNTTITFLAGLHVGASVKFTTSQLNTSGSVDASQVSYEAPFTGSVVSNVEEKLSQFPTLQDFGAVADGVTNDVAAVNAWLASGVDNIIVNGQIRLSSNVTIDSTKSLEFMAGASFLIDSGVTLTIDAQINAGDQQIFFCTGTAQVVASDNNYGTTAYPVRNTKIKAIWFGVIPDAVFPTANGVTPAGAAAFAAGTVPIGQVPTGTDSTAALKMAVQYVQLNAPKSAPFTYSLSTPVLSLPSGTIFVRGHNVMGNRYLVNVMNGLYAIADAGGNALTATIGGVASNVYRNAGYYYHIEGNECMILWKVDAATDVLFESGFTVNKITARDFSVAPIISTNNWGVFFRNKALTSAGSSNNFYNALGPALFENVDVKQNILGGDNSANFNGYITYPSLPNQAKLAKTFWFEGYARGDNITVRNGYYNAFNVFWQGDNPEAVDLRFEDNIIQLPDAGTKVWVFTAFFGGFVASGNFFDIKHNNCTLLEEQLATTYIGTTTVNSFDCTYNFLPGQRYEFKTTLTGWKTFVGVGGRFNMADMNIGTGGTITEGTDASVAYKATANFKDCKVSGKSIIKYTSWSNTSASGQSTGTPKINYDNCEPFIQPWLTGLTWEDSIGGIQDYKSAVENFTQAFAGYGIQNIAYFKNAIPIPAFYATDSGVLNPITATWVDRKNSAQYVYGTGDWLYLWPYIKITSIKLFAQSHSGTTFDNVRLTFGNTAAGALATYVLNHASTGAQKNGTELLATGTALIVPTAQLSYNQVKCELTLGGVVQAVVGVGYFQFTYQVVSGGSELSGLTGVVTNQNLI